MDLAVSGIGSDLTSIKPGVDRVLDNFDTTTSRALQNRVRTIPGASPKAAGKMPGSFTAHGGK